jgi:hypothetical protein
MEILFQSQRVSEPALSIVLLDWSCRESFHIFDYLSSQTVNRKNFEILWIEYYDRRAEAIETAITKKRSAEGHPPVDKWIVLDMPRNLYYYKHLMYNVGIVASAGKIVTFCDSDAIVSDNFVTSPKGQGLKNEPLELAVSGRDFPEWRVSKMRLEAIKLGKMALRKFLPRAVKTYIRSRLRELYRIRSEQ